AACRDALQPCLNAYANGAYAEAVQLCEAAHAASGEPRAGATAARALAQLGAWDRALAWVERLRGTAAEPGLWSVAALVHLRRGEREQAAEAYKRDLALLAKTGDPAGLARAHYGLYFLAWEDSRYREALEAARLSFAAAGKAADRRGQGLAAEALYTVLYALGDLDGAHRALDLAARLFPPDNAADQVRLLGNRGGLALDEGRPALARHDIQQAVDLARGSGDDRFFRSHQLNLVQASLALEDLDGAARHLDEAWRHAEPGSPPETALLFYRARVSRARGDLAAADRALSEALAGDPVLDWVWELEDERGRVAQARGDLAAAEAAWRRSIAAVEQLRGAVGFDDLKAWLLDRKRDPFESLFLLLVRAGRASEALGTVERATVRTFQDAFVEAAATPAAGGALWTAAADRVDALQELLPAMSESPAAALMPVEQALAASRGRRVLVYFEAQGEVWRIDVVRGKARPRRLDTPAERLRVLVDRFRTDPEPGVAAALGALLLPADLTPGELLHVVPDGALARLSFAALQRNGRRLVEDHAIAYVPGVSFLAAA
ncbi:MAG TPA: hypothetical protein DD490_05595, partial [Acidobacteria bacterium]|nr:hypothetical protein [Acidobacteriota bacterium]